MKYYFKHRLWLLLLIAISCDGFAQAGLNKFTFSGNETKVLPGKTPERGNDGKVKPEDMIGRLGLVSLFYQNACYTDGRYNHNNFKVVKGKVKAGKNSFDAYTIYEPTKKAQKFLASRHCVAYKFPKRQNYIVYRLQNGKIDQVATVEASQITTNKPTKIKALKVSNIKGSKVYFFVPSKTKISSFQQLSANAEGAKIKSTPVGEVYKYRFDVKAQLYSIDNRYNRPRAYFLLKNVSNQVSMVWQDKKSKAIYYSRFQADFKGQKSVRLLNRAKAELLAVTNDAQGNLYYLTCWGTKGNAKLALTKTNASGRFIKMKNYDTAKKGLNIYSKGYHLATLKVSKGKIALMIARTMHKSGDGLNHQGGIAVVFDANTLAQLKYLGQTSGHSFDNYLTTNQEGKFLALDLGDNYPRGVHLHRFDETGRRSQVVYTFKTQHGSRAVSPAGRKYDLYAEISSKDKKYYKWSNDNGTYSKLGGLIEVNDGYLVFFTGEPSPTGKSLDNSRAGYKSPDPRNVGFVKVRKDFEKSSSRRNFVSDDLVLSRGKSEIGGFYTFGGRFSKQRNTGVVWLTSYRTRAKASARNLKAAKLPNNKVLLVWETERKEGYRTKYQGTYMMVIGANGQVVNPPVSLGQHVRFNRRDDLLVVGNKVLIPASNVAENKLELVAIKLR
ncbi:MAG TPA: hypothetical protein DCS93_20410 [Microscillaceae bacterium]|nr:hypothetical protein [Microscillaceae bacterium]